MFVQDPSSTVNNRIFEPFSSPVVAASQTEEEKTRFVKVAPDMEQKDDKEESPAYALSISPEAKQTIEDAGKITPAEESEEQAQDKDKKQDDDTKAAHEPWRKGKTKDEQKNVEEKSRKLKQREMDVIKHENAHKAVGGQYAGGISYEKAKGPDGKQYIVGGSVPIDVSPEDTPEKTVAKMKIVRRAALAPASPSDADRAVAATAAAAEAAALKQMTAEKAQNNQQSMKQSENTVEKTHQSQKTHHTAHKSETTVKNNDEQTQVKSYAAQKTLKQGYTNGSLLDLIA